VSRAEGQLDEESAVVVRCVCADEAAREQLNEDADEELAMCVSMRETERRSWAMWR
jgi:hypothetical protein